MSEQPRDCARLWSRYDCDPRCADVCVAGPVEEVTQEEERVSEHPYQQRLQAWGDFRSTRTFKLTADTLRYGPSVTVWEGHAEAPHVEVFVGPCADPETACRLLIERLAEVGVAVP